MKTRFYSLLLSALSTLLLSHCRQDAPPPPNPASTPEAGVGVMHDLGLSYSDTLADNRNPHPNARALFERAKLRAIGGYYLLKDFPNPKDDNAEGPGTNRTSDGKYFEYPTWGAYRAAVQYQLDSLRAIEKKLPFSSANQNH